MIKAANRFPQHLPPEVVAQWLSKLNVLRESLCVKRGGYKNSQCVIIPGVKFSKPLRNSNPIRSAGSSLLNPKSGTHTAIEIPEC